jgi:hypothetical protein
VVLPRSNIDTDQIIPARFLTTTTRKVSAKQLFADWRYDADGSPKPDFMLNQPRRGLRDPGRRPQLRLRLLARARALGAARLRLQGRDQHRDRRHLPQQLAEERPGARHRRRATHAVAAREPGAEVTIDLATRR